MSLRGSVATQTARHSSCMYMSEVPGTLIKVVLSIQDYYPLHVPLSPLP